MIENNKVLYIVCGIIISIIFIFLLNNKYGSNDNIYVKKILKTDDVVDNVNLIDLKDEVPYVNIKGMEAINNQISTVYYSLNKDDRFNYKSNIDDNILYLLIEVEKSDSNKTFFGYYIDLKKEKIISKEELLKRNNKNIKSIKETINESLKNKYNSLISEQYITEEQCDYDCFSDEHEIDLNNNLVFFKENNDLKVYLNYNNKAFYLDENEKSSIEYEYTF